MEDSERERHTRGGGRGRGRSRGSRGRQSSQNQPKEATSVNGIPSRNVTTVPLDSELNKNAVEFVPLSQSFQGLRIKDSSSFINTQTDDYKDEKRKSKHRKTQKVMKQNVPVSMEQKDLRDKGNVDDKKRDTQKKFAEGKKTKKKEEIKGIDHKSSTIKKEEKDVHENVDSKKITGKNQKTQNKINQISSSEEGKSKKNHSQKVQGSSSETIKSTSYAPSIPPNQPQTTNDLNYKSGQKVMVLHIAEKPSIALSIAKGLCSGTFSTSSKSLPIHEFTNTSFPKAPYASKCLHKVTSVAGHVFNVDFPTSYQSWDSVDPADLFHAPIVKKACKSSIVHHLSDSAKGVDFIVLWLDCDREGENICQEVLGIVQSKMDGNDNNPYGRVYRAYFSAINPSDIQKAYNSLGKPDINQSLSVDARQELDLKVGVAFSRFQTKYFQGRYGDLDSAVLSYGPCQTPCLGFCVKRHIDIETFKPEPYWLLDLSIVKRGRIIRAQWNSGRSFNQAKVQKLINECTENGGICEVTNVVSKEKKQGRPVPLNTVNLLKACSKALGIGPHAAMQTAERLYLNGYLSYPRTESTAYPKSFDIRGALQSQSGDLRWGNYVNDLLKKGGCKARGGVDMGDHPPITPCRSAGVHELSGDMSRVYELVTRHFIASVSEDAVWNSTKVELSIDAIADKGSFTIRGKQMISPGFLAVLLHKEYGDDDDEDLKEYTIEDDTMEVENLPDFALGEKFEISSGKGASVSGAGNVNVISTGSRATLNLKEKMTTAPGYLTESELIGQMEKNGIGTDASIATHIENILKRNYVELAQGRRLIPTKLGLVLAQGYHLIDSSLVLPKVRADIEGQCNKIAKGLADKETVLRMAIEIFSNKFANFVKEITKMDVLFSSSFAKLEDVGKPFTRCGITRRYLQFITGPPPRLYNKFTESVYPLPVGGNIKEWSGRKCSAEGCEFELCLYSVGHPERSFPLCPFCFNHPKPEWGVIPGTNQEALQDEVDRSDANKERSIKSMGGRHFMLECPLPDRHPLIEERTIGPDPDSNGVITLDPTNPNKLRLVSTRGPTLIYLPKSIEKITVLDKRDEETNDRLIRVEFKAGQSPLPDGELKYTTCFSKDDLLSKIVRVYHGNERTQGVGRGGRGRGRGGRGRGRGRGRR